MVVNIPTKFHVHSTFRSKIIQGVQNTPPLIIQNSKKPDDNRVKEFFSSPIRGTAKLSNCWGKAKKGETNNFEIWWGIKKEGKNLDF